jgi:fatty acid desaturase
MPSPRARRRNLGEVPTVWLMPLAVLGAIAVLTAGFFPGFGQSPVLSVATWVCVAILLAHGALLIAHLFGWTVWDLFDRPPKPTTTADRDGPARDDGDRLP